MSGELSPSAANHLKTTADFYNQVACQMTRSAQTYRNMLAACYKRLIPASASVLEVGCGGGDLLSRLSVRKPTGVDLSEKQLQRARQQIPDGNFHLQAGEELSLDGVFDHIVVSDTANHAADVQRLFQQLHSVSRSDTRLVVNIYNTLWRPVLSLAAMLGLKSREPASNWLSDTDLRSFLELAGWETLKTSAHILLPVKCFGLEILINRYLAPLLQPLCLTIFCVARPRPPRPMESLTVSVIIPARNEAGNIEAAIRRTPRMGAGTEILFVEGGSSDETWEEMQRVARAYPDSNIRCFRQPGHGKGDAVRTGFAQATGEVLMILDADLTTPPEDLPKFYDVIASGHAEFANGVRLVYPMEEKAMQFLNMCANKAFSLLFT
ncbi:MAG: bifunctional class I SAM-dependent methyltransferase/glycosyltransferase family 2 protein, partial [Akkermansiaceae bacterium]|nr:bifunctional class I SAM-dependent methyltransferase/glycosyltransferase family 2 protein [Akkermansiaceae bacterium]